MITNISIHTPVKGVTDFGIKTETGKKNFNPHSRKGSDFFNFTNIKLCYNFNPHSRKGSDNLKS